MVGSMNVDKKRLIDQVFAKEDLDAFLASILGKAMPGSMAGFEPIAKASKRARTSIAKILDMILQGEITDVRISSSHRGIMSAMVRKDDILHAAVARRPWMTLTAGAKVIGMKGNRSHGLGPEQDHPVRGGVAGDAEARGFLETFTQTYISRWEVSRQYRSMRGPDNRFSVTKAIAMAGSSRRSTKRRPCSGSTEGMQCTPPSDRHHPPEAHRSGANEPRQWRGFSCPLPTPTVRLRIQLSCHRRDARDCCWANSPKCAAHEIRGLIYMAFSNTLRQLVWCRTSVVVIQSSSSVGRFLFS